MKKKKNEVNLSSAEFAQRAIKVNSMVVASKWLDYVIDKGFGYKLCKSPDKLTILKCNMRKLE